MAFLSMFTSISEMINQPSGLWEILILNVFNFIGNYGWRILLFTVLLKLVLFPLDLYQRVKMRKNQLITQRIQPSLDKLKQQYGSNKQVLSQKTMELNKKEGVSQFASCLPMIVTLVIFFYLFSGLNNISQYMNLKQYAGLYDAYVSTEQAYRSGDKKGSISLNDKDFFEVNYKELIETRPVKPSESTGAEYDQWQKDDIVWLNKKDKMDTLISVEAKSAVVTFYESTYRESWLWIQNIWSPDVPWKKPILDSVAFERAIGNYKNFGKAQKKLKIDSVITEADYNTMISKYAVVTDMLAKSDNNRINGFLVLPILSVGLSFLSQFITTRLQKQSGQVAPGGGTGNTMKMMMFIMPFMMGIFALTYTASFTIYIVVNSSMTILINLGTTLAMKNFGKKKDRHNPNAIIAYGRPDPNASTTSKTSAERKADREMGKVTAEKEEVGKAKTPGKLKASDIRKNKLK